MVIIARQQLVEVGLSFFTMWHFVMSMFEDHGCTKHDAQPESHGRRTYASY